MSSYRAQLENGDYANYSEYNILHALAKEEYEAEVAREEYEREMASKDAAETESES